MRVLYRKPDIYEKFEAAIAKAKEGKKHIDSFQISEEEFKEFIDAHWNRDDLEMLDGCMDLIWVTLGFCHMKGFDVTGAWNEVLRSNMAKVDRKTGKVIRREDGKILKPEGWTPPNIKSIFE